MNSKKGDSWGYVQYAVLATIVIVLLAAFTYNYFSKVKEKLAIQDCKNSIGAHALLASITDFEIITDIKCPTRQIVVKTDNEDKAKKQIAEDMRRCWYEWGRGNLTLFEGDGVFCHVCSVYTFKPENKSINGFVYYLGKERIPLRFPDDPIGVSYQDYFQGFNSPNSKEELPDITLPEFATFVAEDYIDTSQKYATIFVYASGKTDKTKALENGGRIGMATRGGIEILLGTAAVGAGVSSAIGMIGTAAAVNFWNPLGWVLGGAVLIGTGIYVASEALSHDETVWRSYIKFKPYNSDELRTLGCEKAPVNQQSNVG